MSGRESLGADDGEPRNFHRSARAPPAIRRHAGHTRPSRDTPGQSLTSRLCRVPGPETLVHLPVWTSTVMAATSLHGCRCCLPGWVTSTPKSTYCTCRRSSNCSRWPPTAWSRRSRPGSGHESARPLVLQGFFTDKLLRQRQASPNTIAAYPDTCLLLLAFASTQAASSPASRTSPTWTRS